MDIFIIKYFIYGILIFMPIITLIHELGHAFFAKIFGGTIKKIIIGTGKTLFSIKNLEIRSVYFGTSSFEAENMEKTKFSRIITLMGGIVFNVISCIITLILCQFNVLVLNEFTLIFILFTINITAFNVFPIQYGDHLSDGMQIYKILYRR